MKRRLSDHIEDAELKRIAQAHNLDNWEWGEGGELLALARMEGAAIAIQAIYDEGRNIEVFVYQSGSMVVFGGAYLNYQIHPGDEVQVPKDYCHKGDMICSMDWDGDPVVKKYECKNQLTLSWDEGGEMFRENDLDVSANQLKYNKSLDD